MKNIPKISIIITLAVLVILGAYSIKLVTAGSNNSNFLANVLEVFSKNEGATYPKQKMGSFFFPEISAKSYIAMYEGDAGKKYLVMKNTDMKLPVASITKITTTLTALNSSNNLLAQFFPSTISIGSSNRYVENDILPVKELIKSMLIESDNDAARAVCENESGNIIERMNAYANYSGAKSSRFYNCTGLDWERGGPNTSTAFDVVELMSTLIKKHPELISVMSMPTAQILRIDGSIHHIAVSTYEHLGKELPFPIIGGKTGQTELAKENLVIVLQVPHGALYIAVLGSEDREGDVKKLAEYVKRNFEW